MARSINFISYQWRSVRDKKNYTCVSLIGTQFLSDWNRENYSTSENCRWSQKHCRAFELQTKNEHVLFVWAVAYKNLSGYRRQFFLNSPARNVLTRQRWKPCCNFLLIWTEKVCVMLQQIVQSFLSLEIVGIISVYVLLYFEVRATFTLLCVTRINFLPKQSSAKK